MSKIKNIKNFDNFKDQYKDYDGYYFTLEEYRESFSAHVCKCGHFAAAPKKCNCNVLEVNAQAYSYEVTGLSSSNVKFLPETLKVLKLSDTLYLISVDAFVFNYDVKTETLDTSILKHSLTFDREKWEMTNVKSVSSSDIFLSLPKAFVLFEIISKAIPSEYDYLNKLAKGLTFLNTDVFNASKDTLKMLKGDTFLNMDHDLEDNLMDIFYKYKYMDKRFDGIVNKLVVTVENLLGEPLEVLASSYGKELLYAASYISNKEFFPDINLAVSNSGCLFDYAMYPPSRINLSSIVLALKPDVEEFWTYAYNKFPSELYKISSMFAYWNSLIKEETRFIETFFNDVSDNADRNLHYYRNSVKSLAYILQTYMEKKELIYNEDDSYQEKVDKINELYAFYKQTIGVIKKDLGVLINQFTLFLDEKNKATSNPNYGIRDYMQLVLKNDLDTKIKGAGKVDFFIELLDQDALYALKLLNTKGRLTKEMKLEAIQKLAK